MVGAWRRPAAGPAHRRPAPGEPLEGVRRCRRAAGAGRRRAALRPPGPGRSRRGAPRSSRTSSGASSWPAAQSRDGRCPTESAYFSISSAGRNSSSQRADLVEAGEGVQVAERMVAEALGELRLRDRALVRAARSRSRAVRGRSRAGAAPGRMRHRDAQVLHLGHGEARARRRSGCRRPAPFTSRQMRRTSSTLVGPSTKARSAPASR